MRIAVDAHAIGSRLTGNETYIRNLLEAIARIDSVNRYDLYFSHEDARAAWEGRYPNFRSFLLPQNPLKRILWAFPRELARSRPDLVHVQYTAPPFCPVPVVSMIHDISYEHFPQYFTPRERRQFRLTIPMTARQAAHVLTVSEYSREDLMRCYRLSPTRVTVTPNGVNERFRPIRDARELARVRERYGIVGPYILSLGNLQPRKNLPTLLRAFERLVENWPDLPHRLVIVGKKAWMYDGIFAELSRLGVADRVVLTDYVPDDDLPAIYSGAECFVYPSLFEGFGLPPLEAMACGTPVIAGDNSAIPEVVGEAGLLIDMSQVEALTHTMGRTLTDAGLRERLARDGLARAASFTWERAARQTLAVYEAVYARRAQVSAG